MPLLNWRLALGLNLFSLHHHENPCECVILCRLFCKLVPDVAQGAEPPAFMVYLPSLVASAQPWDKIWDKSCLNSLPHASHVVVSFARWRTMMQHRGCTVKILRSCSTSVWPSVSLCHCSISPGLQHGREQLQTAGFGAADLEVQRLLYRPVCLCLDVYYVFCVVSCHVMPLSWKGLRTVFSELDFV